MVNVEIVVLHAVCRLRYHLTVLGVLASFLLPVQGQLRGLDSRPESGAFLNNLLPHHEEVAAGWRAVPAFPNLSFNDPTCIVMEPRANRLYVGTQPGIIYLFTNNPATTEKVVFLDLKNRTDTFAGRGLLGFAFHPDYGGANSANRRYIYVYYTFSVEPTAGPPANKPGYNRLSRFTVPDGSLQVDPDSELILINQFDPHSYHNGGGIFFGLDGFLYVSNGDVGGDNDLYGQTQKINKGFFSGVFRIDVDMDPSVSHPIRRQPEGETPPPGWPSTYTQHYQIPNDNPWLDPAGSVLEEFYALGFRSPHRITLDPPTGRIWLGDVGQSSREEVNLVEKGGNYQWSYREGTKAGPRPKPDSLIGMEKPPVHEYGPADSDRCVIGGYVYRGAEHAAYLNGRYVFGDNVSGRVWAMKYDGLSPTTVVYLCTVPNGGTETTGLSSFGVDQAGELYMCVMGTDTKIYKLARTDGDQGRPPVLLSQTGAFADLVSLTPSASLIPYTVNSPLWSDGALKTRWMSIPNDGAPYTENETISFSSEGAWTFPVGSVFIKHFELPINETNLAIRKRLETRFLVRGTNGQVYGLTYKWRADNTDADLLPGNLMETNFIRMASGAERPHVWSYPGRQDCITCHNANAGSVLGVRTCQLNGDFSYSSSGRTDNQLLTLNHIGVFRSSIPNTNVSALPRSVPLTDTTATLEHRVKSYLDANCAQCHRPGGVHGAAFDARLETPINNQGILNGVAADSLGIDEARIVKPQSLEESLLYVRDNLVGPNQMPPLAKNSVDTNYIQVLADWINSLEPPSLTKLIVVPTNSTMNLGEVGQFTARGDYSDGSTEELSGEVNWSSSSPEVATISGTGLASSTSIGTTTISATLSNVIGSAVLNVVVSPLSITTGALPNGVLNVPYTNALTVLGGVKPYNWTVNSGTIPLGLTLEPAGTLRGKPSIKGTWSFALTVTDSGTQAQSMTQTFNVSIYDKQPMSIWPFSAKPQTIDSGPDQPVEVGVKFRSDIGGTAAGIRFYKSVENSGTHVGNLWGADGTRLASATFSNESAFGWQHVNFDVPVTITSNTVYIASYHTSSGHYSFDVRYFALNGVDNYPLHALSDVTARGNGVFIYGVTSSFPSETYKAGNYWVDLLFMPENYPPIAIPDEVQRSSPESARVLIATLLSNDSDPDGDPIVFVAVNPTTANGGIVSREGDWLNYTAPANVSNDDLFTYSISDGRNQPVSGTVKVTASVSNLLNLTATELVDGSFRLRVNGNPHATYRIEYTEALQPLNWQEFGGGVANEAGLFEMEVKPAAVSGQRFYRCISP
jgi:glucose/arabinose dehydrogenase/mono/diheme cytochrome c family protein